MASCGALRRASISYALQRASVPVGADMGLVDISSTQTQTQMGLELLRPSPVANAILFFYPLTSTTVMIPEIRLIRRPTPEPRDPDPPPTPPGSPRVPPPNPSPPPTPPHNGLPTHYIPQPYLSSEQLSAEGLGLHHPEAASFASTREPTIFSWRLPSVIPTTP